MRKVKVILLAADPTKSGSAQLDEEVRTIVSRIRTADEYRADHVLEIIPCLAVRAEDLLPALMQHKPQIVHFSGGGNNDNGNTTSSNGEICILNDAGRARPLNANALVHLLKTVRDHVRVVFLTSCGSESQTDAMKSTVDCTILTTKPIGNKDTLKFVASFYRALGFGRSLQEAFDMGKSSLLMEGVPEDELPEISLLPLVDASEIRFVQAPPTNPVFGSIWDNLDEDLQDAFALAATAARREGKDYISTTTLFAALRRLSPEPLAEFLQQLPEGALPDSVPSAVVAEVVALDDIQSLSPCVNAAMANLTTQPSHPTGRAVRISSEDIFVDIALHGNSKSTVRLRTHGVDQAKVISIVKQLGHEVLMRPDFKDQCRPVNRPE